MTIKQHMALVGFAGLFMSLFYTLLVCQIAKADTLQESIVDIARSELGKGEFGGDNFGIDVLKYTKGRRVSWCAAFVSYVIEKTNKADFKYELGARNLLKQGTLVKEPIPGDLIVFWRESKNGWKGHAGIIDTVTKDRIVSIEGNKGSYPSRVVRHEYKRSELSNLLGFVRIHQK